MATKDFLLQPESCFRYFLILAFGLVRRIRSNGFPRSAAIAFSSFVYDLAQGEDGVLLRGENAIVFQESQKTARIEENLFNGTLA